MLWWLIIVGGIAFSFGAWISSRLVSERIKKELMLEKIKLEGDILGVKTEIRARLEMLELPIRYVEENSLYSLYCIIDKILKMLRDLKSQNSILKKTVERNHL